LARRNPGVRPVFLAAAALAVAAAPGSVAAVVSPAVAGKHDRVRVTITRTRATGVFDDTRRSYTVEAHAVHPRSDCVNNRDRMFADGPAGRRVRAVLDPARGEGGPEGWCRGRFRGTVRFVEGYACPPGV